MKAGSLMPIFDLSSAKEHISYGTKQDNRTLFGNFVRFLLFVIKNITYLCN